MDMDLLLAGHHYTEMPATYVIFICDFDPFGQKKYCYTVTKTFREASGYAVDDGSYTIFLSTAGCNSESEKSELIKFLDFVGSGRISDDDFVIRLRNAVEAVKSDREIGGRYMLFEELLDRERAEARAEGKAEGLHNSIISVLSLRGMISDDITSEVSSITEIDSLETMLAMAVNATGSEEFMPAIRDIKQLS